MLSSDLHRYDIFLSGVSSTFYYCCTDDTILPCVFVCHHYTSNSVGHACPVDELVEQVERRNRLRLLQP
jgi:hypothetical protein